MSTFTSTEHSVSVLSPLQRKRDTAVRSVNNRRQSCTVLLAFVKALAVRVNLQHVEQILEQNRLRDDSHSTRQLQ